MTQTFALSLAGAFLEHTAEGAYKRHEAKEDLKKQAADEYRRHVGVEGKRNTQGDRTNDDDEEEDDEY